MELKVAHTFATVWEAGMAQSLLEAAGVQAFADDGTISNVIGSPFGCCGASGYRLMAGEADLEQAAALLREWDERERLPEPPADPLEADDNQ